METAPQAQAPAENPEIAFTFAGDICYQSNRIEEKTTFPVQRYGHSFDVHRHKAVTGTPMLQFIVEQCFEHEALEEETNRPSSEPRDEVAPGIEGVSGWLIKTQDARQTRIHTSIWKGEGKLKDDTWGELPDHQCCHESVAILGETELLDKNKDADAKLLSGFRLAATHSVSELEENQIKLEEFLFLKKPAPHSDLVLNLDLKHFGFYGEFERLDDGRTFGNLITRLLVPRTANNQPNSKTKFSEFAEAFQKFLDRYKTSRPEGSSSVLVMSSESLRNAGFDISYRVAWERSITGIFKALDEKSKGNDHIAKIIKRFDYLIVNFYNDGALLIDQVGDDPATLVAIPVQTEGDHRSRFSGVMKGTETLITASVAYHLRSGRKEFANGNYKRKRLQMATVHGIKASRYLQSHGNATLHQSSYCVLEGIPFPDTASDDKSTAVKAMVEKLKNSQNDVLRYLWNRTRGYQFAKDGFIPDAKKLLENSKAPNTRFCSWPLGDLVEIISGGYPMFGSFPPVALRIDQGREAVEKETRKVMAAWNDSGWLEIGRFTRADALGKNACAIPGQEATESSGNGANSDDSDGAKGPSNQFHPFWSLRTVAVKHLAAALRAGTKDTEVTSDLHPEIVARFLLSEMMIRFGTQHLNRSGMSPSKQFDCRLIERIALYQEEQIPVPAFYANFFKDFDMNKFLVTLTGEIVEFPKGSKIEKVLALHDWLKFPVSGSTLGIFPGFAIRKLHTIDRRDTQSYRDVRERLIGFQKSESTKPLNLLVLGGPGSGKSFAVKEILSGVYEGVQEIAFLEYNVASFARDTSALTSAFLEIQNVALQNKLPVVFWDEYDTSIGRTPLAWLGAFLGPMQDGKFFMGQSSRFLPKCVFIFAGSVFARFDQIRLLDWQLDASESNLKKGFPCSGGANIRVIVERKKSAEAATDPDTEARLIAENEASTQDHPDSAPKDKAETPFKLPVDIDAWRKAKGRDFKSRITGAIDISSVDWLTDDEHIFGLQEDEDAWLFRRAAAVRSSFEMQASHLLNKDKELQIANDTLFAFLTVDRFDHGYRSIESLIRMSSLHERAVADGSVVPAESQARAHSQTDFFHQEPELTYLNFAKRFQDAAERSRKITQQSTEPSQP